MGGEVTGLPRVGWKSGHVGPLKKVLPVLYLYLLSTLPLDAHKPYSFLLPLQPSEGLCWPQEYSRSSAVGKAKELMPLGVASTNVELVNEYLGVWPLSFDNCEASSRHFPRGLQGG